MPMEMSSMDTKPMDTKPMDAKPMDAKPSLHVGLIYLYYWHTLAHFYSCLVVAQPSRFGGRSGIKPIPGFVPI